MNKGMARRARVRAVVAYPAVSLALAVTVALALSSFGPSPVVALAASVTPAPAAPAAPAATASPTATSSPTDTPRPTPTPSLVPAPASIPSPTLVPGAAPAATPGLTVPGAALAPTVSSGLTPGAGPGDHHVLAWIGGPKFTATYLTVDASAAGASQFQTFRVRFQLENPASVPLTAIPQLEFRPAAGSAYTVVPETPQSGIAFNVTREWVPMLAGGTTQGPTGADIGAADLLLGTQAGVAVSGHHSMGVNPDQPITLAAGSYTEEEFTVQLTMDAKYLTSYELRMTDQGGAALTGAGVTTITLGAAPASRLSPGQRQGGPKAANASGVDYPVAVRAASGCGHDVDSHGHCYRSLPSGLAELPLGCQPHQRHERRVRRHSRSLLHDHQCLCGLPRHSLGDRALSLDQGFAEQPVLHVP